MSASFPSVRLVLHARPLKDGTFSVALRVTFRRKSKFFFLNRNCSRSDWDEKSGRFERSFPEYRRENDVLRTYEQRAADAIRAMERDGVPFTFERLQAAVFSADQVGGATSVVSFLREIRDDLRALGRFGNSKFYQSTANAVFGFRPRAVLAGEKYDRAVPNRAAAPSSTGIEAQPRKVTVARPAATTISAR